jgi:hypothetical protein
MALTPQAALGNKLQQEQAAINALEKQIDDYLAKNYDGRGRVTWTPPNGVSQFVRQEVYKKFRAAGWTVSERSDQREGTWVEFGVNTPSQDNYFGR